LKPFCLGVFVATVLALPLYSATAREQINPHDGLSYAWIEPGSFFTGCPRTDSECIGRERPRQQIVIEKGFWISRTEVTQTAYQRMMAANPSQYRGSELPVEQVDWDSALRYCTAIGMRLPTESEWEFAALGGRDKPRYGSLGSIAWYDSNSHDQTHPVGRKLPNAYGLYDMLGNVWEWVSDRSVTDTNRRIMKGGSFYNVARNLRVAERETPLHSMRHRNVGFRCAAN
jgi:formylglycine-generating enzyme required for sulfatase activity